MPDVTLPSGLVKPEISSATWGNKLNLNWDLMDGLFNRVTTLENLHGGGIANYWPIADGATWAEAQAIITAAQAAWAADNKQIVVFPNSTIEQTATLIVQTPIEIIGFGQTSNSLLQASANLTFAGAGMQIIAFNDTQAPIAGKITFRGFRIKHDRTASTMRMAAFNVADWVRGIEISEIGFETISASCVLTAGNSVGAARIEDMNIHHCTSVDHWESFVDTRQMFITGFQICNNTVTTGSRNPIGSVSSPYGVAINIEDFIANIEDGIVQDNSFTFTTGGQGDISNPSLGITQSYSGASTVRYDKIVYKNNHIIGATYGIRVTTANFNESVDSSSFVAGPGYNVWTGNVVEQCGVEEFDLIPVDLYVGGPGPYSRTDYIIGGNELITNGAQVGLAIDMTNSIGHINYDSADPLADNDIHA